MKQQVDKLLSGLKNNNIIFSEVIAFIEAHYSHQPTGFKNGDIYNEATQNQGSAKVFTFAKLNNLNEADTLYLFAEHYKAVLDTPKGTDHQNIRQFIKHSWAGIKFDGTALTAK